MPFRHIDELPPSVRTHLPRHAQEIFLAAFNHAYQDHRDDDDVEQTAFRIAWGAVKRRYRRSEGVWTERTF